MQIYWTLKSIPELSGLPSDERRRVWLDARRLMVRRSWQFWVSVFGSLTVCITIGDMLIGHPPLGAFIGLVVATWINWQISVYVVRPYVRTLL
jgi:hypothetical protein